MKASDGERWWRYCAMPVGEVTRRFPHWLVAITSIELKGDIWWIYVGLIVGSSWLCAVRHLLLVVVGDCLLWQLKEALLLHGYRYGIRIIFKPIPCCTVSHWYRQCWADEPSAHAWAGCMDVQVANWVIEWSEGCVEKSLLPWTHVWSW